jgi:hypothetical protein
MINKHIVESRISHVEPALPAGRLRMTILLLTKYLKLKQPCFL